MKKQLLAAAVATAMVYPAAAVSGIDFYGRAHLSADYLDNGDDYSELNVSSNSSRLGVRGQRAFEYGLTGMFQIEQQIDFDDSGTEFATRDTFVGLQGDFGMVRIGKFDTPFKRARGPANFFGDQVGDMRNLTRTSDHGRFDERFRNSLHYRSPSMNGFVFDLQYSPERTNATTTEGGDNSGISTSLGYRTGPLNAVLAYEQQRDGDNDPDAWRLAASYQLTSALRVGALYQQTTSAADDDGTVWGLGGTLRINPKTFLNAHVFTLDSDLNDKDATLYAVGLEYRLDSALRFYGNVAMVSNDDASALTPWGQARTATPDGAAGETATGVSLGMRYDF
ncbi:porin [Thioalkalivibrio denitrificans]|uniref:Porin n=1 Tax=Thioalkalivibrio denitrificans TaxID=108003 RepID=A0A1V3NIA5_9GAMM|nr:porin [Thioalkalivibrio denitrificans]OOG24785.1 porin [Thioalkalivibrio denitrificans]